MLLQKDHGAQSAASRDIFIIQVTFVHDVLLLPHKRVIPAFTEMNTEVGREHVDAGYRGDEYASAAIVCVADVKHGVRKHDHLLRCGMFVCRRVGIERYHWYCN